MKLSTKARYGLKAVYVIAKGGGEVVTLPTLSSETGVSAAYLEQLMRLLKRAGIVVSERGASGGYKLSRSADKISLGEIMRALEDNLELIDCLTKTPCRESCPTRVVWQKIYDSINVTLDEITLKDLVDGKVK